MIAVDIAGVRFNYRVGAVCIDQGCVLLNRMPAHSFWFLPGGRCEIGESTAVSLQREMREELGEEVRIGRLIWVVENFFRHDGAPFHELGLYYDVALPAGSRHADKSATFWSPGQEEQYAWFDLGELDRVDLRPRFLRHKLSDLPACPEHIVHRDEVD